MLRFPSARFPSDPTKRVEPYEPFLETANLELGGGARLRADNAMYIAGLGLLVGKLLMMSGGAVLQVLDCALGDGYWAATWFEWDGATRCIHVAGDRAGRKRLMEALADAWPYEAGEGDALYDEARMHLTRELAYRLMDDVDIIAMNFELLVSNADRILSTPRLRDGAAGGLSLVFTYMGRIRYPVSSLLSA